jgi:hypothetical protein
MSHISLESPTTAMAAQTYSGTMLITSLSRIRDRRAFGSGVPIGDESCPFDKNGGRGPEWCQRLLGFYDELL